VRCARRRLNSRGDTTDVERVLHSVLRVQNWRKIVDAHRPVARNVVWRGFANGGAECADGVGVWGGVSPSPVGVGSEHIILDLQDRLDTRQSTLSSVKTYDVSSVY